LIIISSIQRFISMFSDFLIMFFRQASSLGFWRWTLNFGIEAFWPTVFRLFIYSS
jgi:hypothetical protein